MRKKRRKWLETLGVHTGMVIYHGSSAAHLESVRKQGLVPRGARPSNWADEPSRPDAIYLTDSYPHFFGTMGGNLVTIAYEIDVCLLDPRRLLPDEDFVAQKGLVSESHGESIMAAARRRLEEFSREWRNSLIELGTCCYRGKIPASAIKRCCQFNRAMNGRMAIQWVMHQIGLEEHSKRGEYYAMLNAWMFADYDKLPVEWHPAPGDDPNARAGITVLSLR
jgi:hypothetical protein